MRVLIAWDVPREAELIALYLNTAENQAVSCLTAGEVLARAELGLWDAVLMSLTFPKTADEGYELFTKLQEALPDVPVVVGCRPGEMFALPRFLTHGLRFYINRDERGDFIFLVLSCVSSAVAATHAEEARKLAARLREEMDGVRRLQESIIPHGVRPPDGYRVAARYEPSQVSVVGDRPVVMAGGDYYDLFRPDESTLIVLIGDASGHGLKACMSIMTMHTLVRMIRGNHYRQTSTFVAEVNRMMCEQSIVTGDGGFITLLYGILFGDMHEFHWSSAGHPPPLLHNLETNEVAPLEADDHGGMPLGIVSDETYSHCVSKIPPRSRLLLYTDGLVEAFAEGDGEHREFGISGIVETLKSCRELPLEETLHELFEASRRFTGGAGRHDDTSVLIAERA
jgi:serine phosphatase RsbU (regulator of sigma subunit)